MKANLSISGIFLATLATAAIGCTFGSPTPEGDGVQAGVDPGAGGPTTLADRLAEPATLDVTASKVEEVSDGSLVHLHARHRVTGDEVDFNAEVLGGYVQVRSLHDGSLVLRDLQVDVGDVEIPAGVLPPDGVRFSGITASLETPQLLDCDWSADHDHARAVVDLDLVVDWAVALQSGLHPLASLHVEDVPVVLDLDRGADGRIRASFAGVREGVFYNWADLVELSSLTMDLHAAR
jgi:hypothetical protein